MPTEEEREAIAERLDFTEAPIALVKDRTSLTLTSWWQGV